MEFEHVGAHCQHDNCNQKDFLPFKCDTCGKALCLMHRSYVAHDCSGDKKKDMTSIDCPICGKGVRFDKTQDPNVVWDDHYLNSCTQQPNQHEKKEVRCFRPNCRTVLGPSNTYTCGKCHQRVCLAHRIPEEHSCVGHVREGFLRKVQESMAVGNAEKAKKPVRKGSNPVNMFMPAGDGSHQHHSKHQKKEGHGHGHGHVQPPPPAHACPFCGLAHNSDEALVGHVVAFHPDDGASSSTAQLPPPPPPAVSAGAATHREVCPVCRARFPDAISLVRHFEGAHSENAQRTAASTASASDSSSGSQQRKGNDCTVS